MNLAVLKKEINDNPLVYGSLTNQEVANTMNVKDVTRIKATMTGDELFQQTDGAQFLALTDSNKQMWVAFCGRSSIDPRSTANIDFVKFIFGASGATVIALNVARNEIISKAVSLGLGIVTEGDVLDARV